MGDSGMKRLLLGTVFSALASAAFAADVPVPVYKAAPPTVVTAGGWYLSVDGAWQRASLPDYGLGYRGLLVAVPETDVGPFQTFRQQRFDGSQVRGTVGYFLPGNSTVFGANSRVEIGGLYGRASGTDTGSVVFTGGGAMVQFLDGTTPGTGYVCGLAQVCTTNSTLSTNYSNWQLHGRIAGDYRVGAILVTPSLAVFGGQARNNQSLAQILAFNALANRTYNASTSLRWTDVGARAGLDLKLDVTPRVALGLGGWAGFAGRRASLSGTDLSVDPGGIISGTTAISTSAGATPFLANVEAGVGFKWLPALIVRGFVGLNHDSKVPGVSSPSYTGAVPGVVTSRTPAGVSFTSQTSYYAGGGVTWALNAPPP
jgi:hypothetical protein